MKPRALGNSAKALRDEAIMKQADILKEIKEGIKTKTDPYITLTQIALLAHDAIDLLKRMETDA